MDWYIVDEEYINYLLQFDNRIGYINYGDKLKLHVGTVLTIHEHNFYVPISSAKAKHHKMSNSLDFQKIQDKDTGYLYAILNLNNMIPVPSYCLTKLKYTNIGSFRTFLSNKEKTNFGQALPYNSRKSRKALSQMYYETHIIPGKKMR